MGRECWRPDRAICFRQRNNILAYCEGEIFAAANRPNINDANATPDNDELYFTSEDLGAYPGSTTRGKALGIGKAFDAATLSVDNPIEFMCGEVRMAQYPLLIG
jgi:hypothetical protein